MKTFDEILSDLITGVTQKTPFTNLNVGAGLRGILEAVASAVGGLYQLLHTASQGIFVQTASGGWLDLKAREVGVKRLQGQAARIQLTFSSNSPAGSDTLIPAGTIVRSRKNLAGVSARFVTEADVTLLTGETEVVVVGTAEAVGTAGNVGPGTVTVIVTPVAGIQGVTKVDVDETSYLLTEGADPESDQAFRERAIAKWDTLGVGGNRTAYYQWAMSVDGVKAAMVLDEAPYGPGTVGVVILGTAGAPSAQLLLDVKDYIRPRQPLTAVTEVTGATITEVDVDVLVTLFPTADSTTVNAAVTAALEAFGDALQLGESLVRARMIATVMDVDGVYNVQILSPTSDLSAAPAEYLNLASITVTNSLKKRNYVNSAIDESAGEAVGSIPPIDQSEWEV